MGYPDRLVIDLPDGEREHFKSACTLGGVTMRHAVTKFVHQYITDAYVALTEQLKALEAVEEEEAEELAVIWA